VSIVHRGCQPDRSINVSCAVGKRGRVDARCAAVTQLDHVRRMPQTFVDELVHMHHTQLRILKELLEQFHPAYYVVK
jgi:hypothetical protein